MNMWALIGRKETSSKEPVTYFEAQFTRRYAVAISFEGTAINKTLTSDFSTPTKMFGVFFDILTTKRC